MGLLDKIKKTLAKDTAEEEHAPAHNGELSPPDLDNPPYTYRNAMCAIARGEGDKVAEHIRIEPRYVQCKDWDDSTLLHQAAHYARPDMVKLLVEEGADVNAVYKDKTPLHFAVCADALWVTNNKKIDFTVHRQEMVDTVTLLLEHGAKPDLIDDKGETPLHTAVRMGHTDAVQVLLEQGASVDLLTGSGESEGDHTEGRTPLLLAARYSKSRKIIRFLLEKGANPDAQDNDPGYTPLHYIAFTPHLKEPDKEQRLGEVAEILLECKANPNIHSIKKGRQTPLHLAAARNHVAVAKALLEHGADLHAQNSKDMMAISIAASEGSMDMVECLLEHGVDPYESRALFFAAYCKDDPTVMELLIKRGVDINRPDGHGITALFAAVSVNSFVNVKYLLDKGADPTLHPPQRTLLQHAYANWGAVEAMPDEQKKVHAKAARDIIKILGGFD